MGAARRLRVDVHADDGGGESWMLLMSAVGSQVPLQWRLLLLFLPHVCWSLQLLHRRRRPRMMIESWRLAAWMRMKWMRQRCLSAGVALRGEFAAWWNGRQLCGDHGGDGGVDCGMKRWCADAGYLRSDRGSKATRS